MYRSERIPEFRKKKISMHWEASFAVLEDHVNIIKQYNAFYDLSHTSKLPPEYAASAFFNKIVHLKVFLKHIENSNAALCFHGPIQTSGTIIIKAMHFYVNKQFLVEQKRNFTKNSAFHIVFWIFPKSPEIT